LVAYADFVVGKAVDSEILPKLSEGEIVACEEALPIAVGFGLVDKNGALFSAMTGEISLSIAIDIQFANDPPAFHGRFPDRSTDGLAIPGHLTRKTHVYRK
jgi:hypothetical protein